MDAPATSRWMDFPDREEMLAPPTEGVVTLVPAAPLSNNHGFPGWNSQAEDPHPQFLEKKAKLVTRHRNRLPSPYFWFPG